MSNKSQEAVESYYSSFWKDLAHKRKVISIWNLGFYLYMFNFLFFENKRSYFVVHLRSRLHRARLRDPGTKNNFFLVIHLSPIVWRDEKSRTRLYFLWWYPRKPVISSSMNTLLSLLWSDNFYSTHLHWRHTLIYN